jgi:hypothetical protein
MSCKPVVKNVSIVTYTLSPRQKMYWDFEGRWRGRWTTRFRVAIKRRLRKAADEVQAVYWEVLAPEGDVLERGRCGWCMA